MAQPMKTEAISRFLESSTLSDLAELYSFSMEVQVNVAQDGGERIDGDYKGRKWSGWTDSFTTWKAIRIPFNASTKPDYIDTAIRYDLFEHAEAVGMTGWDWKNKVSRWVAYDFDSIINHADGLTPKELQETVDAVAEIEWVTIRRSTSGSGYHLYVFLPEVPTDTHTEHAALARSILGQMSALAGFDFQSKVDCCGGNMWIWHRKMKGTNGLQLVKKGCMLDKLPVNWRDHIKVVTGSRRKNLPQKIENPDVFDTLIGQRNRVTLDDEHKRLIDYLKDSEALWWWDSDNQMLVTHTFILKQAHIDLGMLGVFETSSRGTNTDEQNCFCFPLRKGAWHIRRFTPGVNEADIWQQDGQGWTNCYYNREADFTTACRQYGGVKDPKGCYVFSEATIALKAASLLGVHLDYAPRLAARKTKLKMNNDFEIIVEIDKEPTDPTDQMQGWLNEKNKNWTRVERVSYRAIYEPEVFNYDDVIRHLVSDIGKKDCGWALNVDSTWHEEPKTNIKDYLKSLGHKANESDVILGSQISKPWKLVCKPFQPEFPGDREWNRNAAQLRFTPTRDTDNLNYPTWLSVLKRIGNGLDDPIKQNGWCITNGISSGADYLKCWVASLFQYPMEPLPYLFLFGPQNSGKTAFYEAIKLLLTKGVMDASAALTADHNRELKSAILCYVDEKNLQKNATAYDKIKEWVTAKEILIHAKYETPYMFPNTTHWIQVANDPKYCPIFPGDTRITMIYVDQLQLEDMINRRELFIMLEKEAADFLSSILHLDLPPSNDRLNIPIVESSEKMSAQEANKNELEVFVDEKCKMAKGYSIKFSEFFDAFQGWLDPQSLHIWTKNKVGRNIPMPYLKARVRGTAQFHIGNIAWLKDDVEVRYKYIVKGGYLEEVDHD